MSKIKPKAGEDYLNLGGNAKAVQALKKAGDGSEKIFFSDHILKINKRGKEQIRVLLLTNSAVYNMTPDKFKIKRRIPIKKIGSVSCSVESGEFVVHVPGDYDYRFNSGKNERITELIGEIFAQQSGGNRVELRYIAIKNLGSITQTKHIEENIKRTILSDAHNTDVMSLAKNDDILRMLRKRGDNDPKPEQLLTSDMVGEFYGNKDRTKTRCLIITDKATYLLEPETYEFRDRIPHKNVKTIVLSKISGEFIVHGEGFNVRLVSTRHNQVVDQIDQLYRALTGLRLSIRRVVLSSLKDETHEKLLEGAEDESELEAQFQAFLDASEFKPHEKAHMLSLPAQTKWFLMAQAREDTELVPEDPEELERMKEARKAEADSWVKQFQSEDATVEDLVRFRTQALSSSIPLSSYTLHQFVKSGGLQALMGVPDNTGENMNKMTLEVVWTLKSVMDMEIGLAALVNTETVVSNLVQWLQLEDDQIRLELIQMLSAICWMSDIGHELIVQGFQNLQKSRSRSSASDEKEADHASASHDGHMLSVFLNMLLVPDADKSVTLLMNVVAFVNVIINTFDDVEERAQQRFTFLEAGFSEAADSLRRWISTKKGKSEEYYVLLSQLDAFDKEFFRDEKDLEMDKLEKTVKAQVKVIRSSATKLARANAHADSAKNELEQMRSAVDIERERLAALEAEQKDRLARDMETKSQASAHEVKRLQQLAAISLLRSGAQLDDVKKQIPDLEVDAVVLNEATRIKTEGVPSSTDAVKDLPQPIKTEPGAPAPAAAAAAAAPPPGAAAAPPPGAAAAPPPGAIPIPGAGAAPPMPGAGVGIGGAPPIPPPLGVLFGSNDPDYPLREQVTPSVPMRPFHWSSVSVRTIRDTVWKELKDDDITLDTDELEKRFCKKVTVSKAKKEPKKTNEEVKLVDAKRSYNIAIGLSRVDMSFDAIAKAILELDSKKLDQESVSKLIHFAPTPEEVSTVLAYTGDAKKLAQTERFFLALAPIQRVKTRLQLMYFRTQFEALVEDVDASLDKVRLGLEEIRDSENFQLVLQLVLKIGNYLNGGTKKGGIYGFKLSALKQLSNTKSVDNKHTLLDYVVQYARDNYPLAESFLEDLLNVPDAARIEEAPLGEQLAYLRGDLKNLENALEQDYIDTRDRFVDVMQPFYDNAEARISDLALRYQGVKTLCHSLLKSYGEAVGAQRWEDLLRIFTEFITLWKHSVKQNELLKQQEARKKKRASFINHLKSENGAASPAKKPGLVRQQTVDSVMGSLLQGNDMAEQLRQRRAARKKR